MGVLSKKDLTEEEIDELKENFVFDAKEIEILYERFNYLDKSSQGFLTFSEFSMIPEFHANPFSRLIIAYLEERNHYEKLNFACFLEFLSIFSSKTDKHKRIEFLFNLFDLNKNGKLTKTVLREISAIMCEEPNEEDVNATMKMYDKGKKGYLSRNDFAELYNDDDSLERNMVIDFKRNVQEPKNISVWDIIWPTKKID